VFQQRAQSPEAIEKLSLKGMTASDSIVMIKVDAQFGILLWFGSLNTLSSPPRDFGVSGGQKK
jgi:hypothetical protein